MRLADGAGSEADALVAIRVGHEADKAYDAPRVTELNDGPPAQGRVNHKRVARG